MFKGGILFPLGIVFLAFGGYEASKHGMTEHVMLLLAMGGLNIVYTVGRMAMSKSRG